MFYFNSNTGLFKNASLEVLSGSVLFKKVHPRSQVPKLLLNLQCCNLWHPLYTGIWTQIGSSFTVNIYNLTLMIYIMN